MKYNGIVEIGGANKFVLTSHVKNTPKVLKVAFLNWGKPIKIDRWGTPK